MFRLKTVACVSLAALIFLAATAIAGEQIMISGRAEVVYNKGNGLNHYYIHTSEKKYRVWTHILDPDQDAKERMLENAAKTGATVTVLGEMSGSGKDAKILIKNMKIGK